MLSGNWFALACLPTVKPICVGGFVAAGRRNLQKHRHSVGVCRKRVNRAGLTLLLPPAVLNRSDPCVAAAAAYTGDGRLRVTRCYVN